LKEEENNNMPVFNVSRENVEALINPQISREIIQGVTEGSTAFKLFTRLPNMTSDMKVLPVLASLPEAQWVDEEVENGRKATTYMAWDKKVIRPCELAVIVPIKENLLDDASYDLWGQIKPRVIESFYRRVDEAIFIGVNKPKSFRADILTTIKNVGAEITPASGQSFYSAINDAMVMVENSGYDVNGFIGGTDLKGKFRMMLDDIGQPVSGTEIGSIKRYIMRNGVWDKTKSQMIVGDLSQAVYSIRQDITVKLLTESVIQDEGGAIIYNLAQQDMVALRFTMRFGWEIPNPINALSPDESVRFPFASVAPPTAPTYNTVKFTVTDSESQAVSGARIICSGIAKTTDTDGFASFALGNGNYTYKITKSGHKAKTGDVTVAGAETVTVTDF